MNIYPSIGIKENFVETWLRKQNEDGKWYLVCFKIYFKDVKEPKEEYAKLLLHKRMYECVYLLQLTAESINTMNQILSKQGEIYAKLDENQESEYDRLSNIMKGIQNISVVK